MDRDGNVDVVVDVEDMKMGLYIAIAIDVHREA